MSGEYQANPRGLGWELFEKLHQHKDNIGQICCESGVKETYGSVLERTIRTALEMRRRGISAEDVVLVCSSNHMNSAIPWIAGLFLGCKVSALDPSLVQAEIDLLMRILSPKIVFVSPRALVKVEKAWKNSKSDAEIVTFGKSSFLKFLKPSPEEKDFVPVACANLLDTALIMFSSGSTGNPKGICVNHYALMDQAANFRFEEHSSYLIYTNLYWVSSVKALIGNVIFGTPRLIARKFDLNEYWDIVESRKVAFSFLPPHSLLELLDAGIPKTVDLSSLKLIMTGGSSASADLMVKMRENFPRTIVIQAMGQTEMSGVTFAPQFKTPEGFKAMMDRPASVGQIRPNFEYKIVDLETQEILGPNQKGELRLKTPLIMNGFYKMDSSKYFDEDGYYKTGDLMYFDEEGWFYHVDRIGEVFKCRQMHVHPVMLEEILEKHPAVLKAVVVGVPHAKDGHHPLGLVQLKKEAANVTPEEIKAFFEERADETIHLKGGLKIVDSFPVTATGKISRNMAKKLYST